MQLSFLGEQFTADKCKGMCDNCRQGLVIKEEDRTVEAKEVISFL
jgi:hypothetical protein